MIKYTESTPCPVPQRTAKLETPDFQPSEPTEELNFTTKIQVALVQAAPRRRKSIRPQINVSTLASQRGLAVPLQDLGALMTKLRNDQDQSEEPVNCKAHAAGSGLVPARRRVSLLLAERADNLFELEEFRQQREGTSRQDATHMRKKPRRRTIYVPFDDTTILTIHPGLKSGGTGLNNVSLSAVGGSASRKGEVPAGTSLMAQGNRKPLAAAPKRVPLQPTLKPLQESEDQQDIGGSGPGKENIAPNASSLGAKSSRPKRVSIFGPAPECGICAPNGLSTTNKSSATDKVTVSSKSVFTTAKLGTNLPCSSEKKTNANKPRHSMMNTLYNGSTWPAPVESGLNRTTAEPPSKLVSMVNTDIVMSNEKYPILREDIKRAEMFEDNWLDNQQSAIQQLANGLFEATQQSNMAPFVTQEEKRLCLLRLYQSSDCYVLRKRLQASLLYGALSPPKGSAADASRLRSDIGLRQEFITTWIESYDLESLHAATEVVMGREATSGSKNASTGGQQCASMAKIRKREMEGFIDSCLLRNKDMVEPQQQPPALCWRRTVLRSLMIIFLMDKAKEMKLISGNLFLTSSRFKSSRSVLTQLSNLLLPSIGDIFRPLSHLDYHIHHYQSPLSEYQYNIENLATDLRDGVRLARLTELLLYPPELLTQMKDNITIAMPTGEVLTSTVEEGQSWVLSQHLKFPCIARAQKVYNVQIALSALQGIRGVGQITEDLRAEDIVNGHRERTVALLWALVGKWGLDTLVDFEALRKEVSRLKRLDRATIDDACDVDEDDEHTLERLKKQTHWLKAWARTIAQRHGLRVLNLTTSFADGKVFDKIVDEYQLYLSEDGTPWNNAGSDESSPLETKLKGIGCSSSFALIFGHRGGGRIFDRDFTIAALAFLCSRLLAKSKRGRAAGVIQRAYRQARMRESIRQRVVLTRISQECKAVFVARRKVMEAAQVIQRAWRSQLNWRRGIGCGPIRNQQAQIEARVRKEKIRTRGDNVDIWLP